MKKSVYFFALAACLAFVSCNSSTDDNNTRAVEEKEDKAQKAAEQMEDAAEDHDTTAVEIQD